jgi:hypothetical protein
MKLTGEFLKQEAHNFDLECVYVLDVSRRGVRDLGELRSCLNLELANLSFNEINDLSSLSLAKMPKLQYLNLAFNQLTHLSGLESLESLRSLNLAGNHLDSVDEFYKLRGLDNLTQLTLTDLRLNASNPVCQSGRWQKHYKAEISRLLPQLELIDGESFKSSGGGGDGGGGGGGPSSPVKSDYSLRRSLDETLRQSIHESSNYYYFQSVINSRFKFYFFIKNKNSLYRKRV